MTAALLWRPRAREDLLDIFEIIGVDNLAAAERILAVLESRAQTLATHPRLGLRRRDIGPTVRVLIEGQYLILYETHPNTDESTIDTIEIVRVIDSKQVLTRLS